MRGPAAVLFGFLVAFTINAASHIDPRQTIPHPRTVPSEMVGAWSGDAEIFVNWTVQRSLPVPLNWIERHFEGGVNTSGSHLGGKKSMWLAAGRVRLERSRRP
jgi:hypothetical protein